MAILVPIFADETSDNYITFTTQRRFSETSPLDIVDFYFYQGDKELTFAEFKEITKDPLITRTDKMLRSIVINGSVVGSIFGLTFLGSLIPSAILIDKALLYDPVSDDLMFSGIAMIALSAVSVVGIVVDIIVSCTLYHRFSYNETIIRTIVANYNRKLRQAKILPDMSFLEEEFEMALRVRI
jgi:hypothetical protein